MGAHYTRRRRAAQAPRTPQLAVFSRCAGRQFVGTPTHPRTLDRGRTLVLACWRCRKSVGFRIIHLEKNRPKLDTLVIGNGRRPSIAIEFKYHRQENNLKPQLFWAGRLLYDFYRLQNLKLKPPTRKLAVYVANGQMMKNYERGAKSWGGPLSELTSMEDGAVLQLGLPDKAPKCFLERARHKNENGGFEEATVKCLHHTHYAAGGQCKSTNDLFVFEIVK